MERGEQGSGDRRPGNGHNAAHQAVKRQQYAGFLNPGASQSSHSPQGPPFPGMAPVVPRGWDGLTGRAQQCTSQPPRPPSYAVEEPRWPCWPSWRKRDAESETLNPLSNISEKGILPSSKNPCVEVPSEGLLTLQSLRLSSDYGRWDKSSL